MEILAVYKATGSIYITKYRFVAETERCIMIGKLPSLIPSPEMVLA
jgi:hypothetical protein